MEVVKVVIGETEEHLGTAEVWMTEPLANLCKLVSSSCIVHTLQQVGQNLRMFPTHQADQVLSELSSATQASILSSPCLRLSLALFTLVNSHVKFYCLNSGSWDDIHPLSFPSFTNRRIYYSSTVLSIQQAPGKVMLSFPSPPRHHAGTNVCGKPVIDQQTLQN